MVGGNAPLPDTPQVQAMRKAKFTEEEIADVLNCDKEIDRGAKLFELDAELQAGAKKARRADRTDTPKPRERKPNEDKRFLLRVLKNALENHDDPGFGEEFQGKVVNPEREFLFTFNGIKYKVVLSCPRS